MTRWGLAICSILLVQVVSCITGERITRLEPGMTKAEVINVLGRPDSFKSVEEYEGVKYTNKLISGWSWDRADYVVIFKNGRVVEYGAGDVRQRDPNVGVLVLVPAP